MELIFLAVFNIIFVGIALFVKIEKKEVIPPDDRLMLMDKFKFSDTIKELDDIITESMKKKLVCLEPSNYNIQFKNNIYSLPSMTDFNILINEYYDKFKVSLSKIMIIKLSLFIEKDYVNEWVYDRIKEYAYSRYKDSDIKRKEYDEKVRKESLEHAKRKKEKDEAERNRKAEEVNKIWKVFDMKPIISTDKVKADESDVEFMKSRYLLKKKELDNAKSHILSRYKSLIDNNEPIVKESFRDVEGYIEFGDEIPLILTAEALGWDKIKENPNIIEKSKMTVIDYLLPLNQNPKALFGTNMKVPPSKYKDDYGMVCKVYERVRPVFYKDYIYEKGYTNSVDVIKNELGDNYTIMERVI